MSHHLHGSCSCGRNKYVISLPEEVSEHVEVVFVDSRPSGHSQIPLLRIPLASFQSTTYSYLPDETHSSIRRLYIPTGSRSQHERRHFCGFCGTPLTRWSEETEGEAEWICVVLSTVSGEGLSVLEEMGVVEDIAELGRPEDTGKAETSGGSWISRMIPGFGSGDDKGKSNVKRSSGRGVANGLVVEWEVMEWVDDEQNESKGATTTKRKHEVLQGGDEIMDGLH